MDNYQVGKDIGELQAQLQQMGKLVNMLVDKVNKLEQGKRNDTSR